MTDNPRRVRIALADDHWMVRKGIIELIAAFGDFEVILEAGDGEELIQKLEQATVLPDICILDINMPSMNGYDTLTQLKKRWPELKVMILTMFNNELTIIRMLRNGANGFMLKAGDPKELGRALRAIYEHGFYHGELVTSTLAQWKESATHISNKELQFLSLCCSDLNYKEIANIMGMSVRTIDGYRDSLFEKLDLRSRTGLVIFALSMGIEPYDNNMPTSKD